ncbi:MAG: [protein-PII] uridylyltransferase [Gammaproteobacteria bacterium]|nr:[protein-PII] uridylyltransferase [Gammaproteobacteria bacterium]
MSEPKIPVARLRQRLDAADAALAKRYWAGEDIGGIVSERAAFFDGLLQEMWRGHFSAAAQRDLALFAVGGYGRGELHPGSDIDLLILGVKPSKHRAEIEPFVRALFDLNLEIGHSVRNLADCKATIKADLTVATALFERRLLTELQSPALRRLIHKLDAFIDHPRTWPADRYFQAKRAEQERRHARFEDVESDLEPNIKDAPGGLRDLQTVLWVCRRKYGTADAAELERLGVLTGQERRWLSDGQRYLWWVRYGLHLVAQRKDDRLQFEHQRTLAQQLGYADTTARPGVERFMHEYYRWVLSLREVNDIVLQFLEESFAPARPKRERINDRFQINADAIEAVHDRVFTESPSALLELFVILANRRDIGGVRAATIRLIRQHLTLIDDGFRNDPGNSRLFLELLKAPYTLVTQLTRMRRYGILGRYIPEFGQVVGQMQHDLFHIYTVDAHTMMVIRNMRLFRYRAQAERFPLAHHCVKTIPKVELLYIAGLYHDMGKGRGGDHSQIGARFAVQFCRRLGLNDDDTELVEWLVAEHLVMSDTAQRRDIHDPQVVLEFARFVKSERRLDYLYALTVADITATNPTLWNSWRATLLRQLHASTRKLLREGIESPLDRQATLRACRESATEQATALGLPAAEAHALWALMGDGFMLRHSAREMAEIAVAVANHDLADGPLVLLRRRTSEGSDESATELFIHAQDRANLFADTVTAINRLRLRVYDARIHTADNGQCFNTFVVLDQHRQPVRGDGSAVIESVVRAIRESRIKPLSRQRLPRQHRQLHRPTKVRLQNDAGRSYSTLSVHTTDRPGLLARIGALFSELDVALLAARIVTLGERVEDVFHVQTRAGEPITDAEAIYQLENTLRQALDSLPP